MTQRLQVGDADDTSSDHPRGRYHRALPRNFHRFVLLILLVALSASFYYGWFHDHSHPLGGGGWFDQALYTSAAQRLADGHLPNKAMLHYAPGYSFLGALGTFLSREDPFWLVSYGLLIGSAALCYQACRKILNEIFAAIMLLSLFAWDGHSRSFEHASELFTVPWNNQLLFFAFAFFFWLYATRGAALADIKLVAVAGVIVGFVAMTREESVLFLVPLAVIYLLVLHAPGRAWLVAAGAAFLAMLPGLMIKWIVLGSLTSAGSSRRGGSYAGVAGGLFSASRFARNVRDVLVDSSFAATPPHRRALFQAEPRLWIGLVGLLVVFASKHYSVLLKWFVAFSLALIAFYLSGGHMSAAKLKFHCLRYITPGYIALHLGVVVVLFEGWRLVTTRRHRSAAEDSDPDETAYPEGTDATTMEKPSAR